MVLVRLWLEGLVSWLGTLKMWLGHITACYCRKWKVTPPWLQFFTNCFLRLCIRIQKYVESCRRGLQHSGSLATSRECVRFVVVGLHFHSRPGHTKAWLVSWYCSLFIKCRVSRIATSSTGLQGNTETNNTISYKSQAANIVSTWSPIDTTCIVVDAQCAFVNICGSN